MDNMRERKVCKKLRQLLPIHQIPLDKFVRRMTRPLNIFQIGMRLQTIEIDYDIIRRSFHPKVHEIRPDEPRSAGHQNHLLLLEGLTQSSRFQNLSDSFLRGDERYRHSVLRSDAAAQLPQPFLRFFGAQVIIWPTGGEHRILFLDRHELVFMDTPRRGFVQGQNVLVLHHAGIDRVERSQFPFHQARNQKW